MHLGNPSRVYVQKVVFLVQQRHAQVELPSEQIHGLGTFHPQNEGVNFRQAYRWGLRGPYLQFTQVDRPSFQPAAFNSLLHSRSCALDFGKNCTYNLQVNLGDVFQHWKNGKLLPCLGRFLRIWRGREKLPYFV